MMGAAEMMLSRRTLVWLWLVLLGLSAIVSPLGSAAFAQSKPQPQLVVDWLLTATDKPLERVATITLKDPAGQPIAGARIEINVDMPSMPMMHRVPMTVAEPTGEPGSYRARFTLEMAGQWAARIEVKQPLRMVVVKRFEAR